MREELMRQHKDETERRSNRGMLNKTMGNDSGPERPAETAFMDQLPPGMAEALERQKGTKAGTLAERDAERFAILENAPRQGDFTKDLQVHHRPFGVSLKNAKCSRCQQWGHSLGDRECPMRDVNPQDDERKGRLDPMAGQMAGAESSGAPLRWSLKSTAAPGGGIHGYAAASDANQQFVVDEGERQAAAQSALLADLDPAVLAALNEKQQRKLLKMYNKELKSAAAADSDGDSDGEAKRKRKKEKKEKKERKERKEKKSKGDKHHKKKRRRHSGSGSDSGSESD